MNIQIVLPDPWARDPEIAEYCRQLLAAKYGELQARCTALESAGHTNVTGVITVLDQFCASNLQIKLQSAEIPVPDVTHHLGPRFVPASQAWFAEQAARCRLFSRMNAGIAAAQAAKAAQAAAAEAAQAQAQAAQAAAAAKVAAAEAAAWGCRLSDN